MATATTCQSLICGLGILACSCSFVVGVLIAAREPPEKLKIDKYVPDVESPYRPFFKPPSLLHTSNNPSSTSKSLSLFGSLKPTEVFAETQPPELQHMGEEKKEKIPRSWLGRAKEGQGIGRGEKGGRGGRSICGDNGGSFSSSGSFRSDSQNRPAENYQKNLAGRPSSPRQDPSVERYQGNNSQGYNQGYPQGHSHGYSQGYPQGHSQGYFPGYPQGNVSGYSQGGEPGQGVYSRPETPSRPSTPSQPSSPHSSSPAHPSHPSHLRSDPYQRGGLPSSRPSHLNSPRTPSYHSQPSHPSHPPHSSYPSYTPHPSNPSHLHSNPPSPWGPYSPHPVSPSMHPSAYMPPNHHHHPSTPSHPSSMPHYPSHMPHPSQQPPYHPQHHQSYQPPGYPFEAPQKYPHHSSYPRPPNYRTIAPGYPNHPSAVAAGVGGPSPYASHPGTPRTPG